MLRRSFLGALSVVSALPIVPDRVRLEYPPPMPSERNILFWYHVYSAIQRDRPMSTARARQQTVSELSLTDISEEKAAQILRLANDGVYETGDLPERWQGVFEEMEQEWSR